MIVEDDEAVVELLSTHLSREGFDISSNGDGEEALAMIEARPPDLIVLDLMLPGMSGIELCRSLRRARLAVPIVIVTGRSSEADRIRGLESGADDYLTKPFSLRELTVRIRTLLRRSQPAASISRLEYAGIAMDTSSRRVTRDGTAVSLGPTEYRLLRYLLENPDRVFSANSCSKRYGAIPAPLPSEPLTPISGACAARSARTGRQA